MMKKTAFICLSKVRRHIAMLFRQGWLIAVPGLLIACAATPQQPELPRTPLPQPQPHASAVALEPGDEIDVKFQFWPELNEVQKIQPDGNISLQLVGNVLAAGLTPEQLTLYLEALYQSKIRKPVITVIVRNFANRNIYVGGEVRKPGVIPLRHRMSVLEAIMTAGGFDKLSARIENIIVVRHVKGRRYTTLLNLKEELENPESTPFYLISKDIVYVPRTRIDKANQWVDQYISKMIPSIFVRLAD
ncbi:sugar transporter [Desulfonema ishimotonii]|uniref:Sugar transporter n=1 Tax=Desulfonema ishimotonii TaxID=45657 RepID=A0A401G3F6_9BACT|nr:polysaccharide biosynthesis/export family protein [Desulfonema ishimotonii]GBC63777.1 sugar transporter [Desulfonema ishimotonii]